MSDDDPRAQATALARQCAARMYRHDTASRTLGISVEIPAAGQAVARLEITPSMINGFGLCHGGYLFTLADTAFAFACNAYGPVTVAAAAAIDFLHPVHAGDRLEARAEERHRGRRRGIYDVTVRNQAGRVVALFRGRARATEGPPPESDGAGPDVAETDT